MIKKKLSFPLNKLVLFDNNPERLKKMGEYAKIVLRDYYTYDNISPAESETKLTGDDLTNFPEVFASKADMTGIQKLIDEYLKDNKD